MVVMTVFLLSACSPAITVVPTATAIVTPDASMATPATGFAIVKNLSGNRALFLSSQPDNKSAKIGQAHPGESGKVLGFDATGTWALLDFKGQSGWAPVDALDLTIAQ